MAAGARPRRLRPAARGACGPGHADHVRARRQVIGNPALASFPAYGSFAMLLLVDFSGSIRDRLLDQTGLAVACAVLICVGTLASRTTWLAAVAMAVVAFAILFAGVVSWVLAGATTSLLLAFILPVALPAPASAIPAGSPAGASQPRRPSWRSRCCGRHRRATPSARRQSLRAGRSHAGCAPLGPLRRSRRTITRRSSALCAMDPRREQSRSDQTRRGSNPQVKDRRPDLLRIQAAVRLRGKRVAVGIDHRTLPATPADRHVRCRLPSHNPTINEQSAESGAAPARGEYEVRRGQALETRFGVTTVLRAGPPTRTLPLPTRGSVDGPHARALASRPKCHGVLAEIETAPPRADCSSRGTGLPRGAFGGVVTRLQLRVGSRGPGWCARVAASEA